MNFNQLLEYGFRRPDGIYLQMKLLNGLAATGAVIAYLALYLASPGSPVQSQRTYSGKVLLNNSGRDVVGNLEGHPSFWMYLPPPRGERPMKFQVVVQDDCDGLQGRVTEAFASFSSVVVTGSQSGDTIYAPCSKVRFQAP